MSIVSYVVRLEKYKDICRMDWKLVNFSKLKTIWNFRSFFIEEFCEIVEMLIHS